MKPKTKTVFRCLVALVALYVISFGCVFQLFSSPVRDNDHGWLGPAKRSDPQVTDIGKVLYYEGTDFTAYRFHSPLCAVWLLLNGLS